MKYYIIFSWTNKQISSICRLLQLPRASEVLISIYPKVSSEGSSLQTISVSHKKTPRNATDGQRRISPADIYICALWRRSLLFVVCILK